MREEQCAMHPKRELENDKKITLKLIGIHTMSGHMWDIFYKIMIA
jgi:hypothetical protein